MTAEVEHGGGDEAVGCLESERDSGDESDRGVHEHDPAVGQAVLDGGQDRVLASGYLAMQVDERRDPAAAGPPALGLRHRQAAHDQARRAHAELVSLRCAAPAELTTARLLSRLGTGDGSPTAGHPSGFGSDADPLVLAAMTATADPWPQSHTIDTAGAWIVASSRRWRR